MKISTLKQHIEMVERERVKAERDYDWLRAIHLTRRLATMKNALREAQSRTTTKRGETSDTASRY